MPAGFQGVTNQRAAALSRRDIWPLHRRDRGAKAKFAESSHHLDIIFEATIPQRRPSDVAGRILSDQGLLFL
jgi:hypothetical protein